MQKLACIHKTTRHSKALNITKCMTCGAIIAKDGKAQLTLDMVASE